MNQWYSLFLLLILLLLLFLAISIDGINVDSVYFLMITLKFTSTLTRCGFDCIDMPKVKLINKETFGGICVCSFYNHI